MYQSIDHTDLIKLKKIKHLKENLMSNVPPQPSPSPPPLPPDSFFEFDGFFDSIKKQIVVVIGLNKLFDFDFDMDISLDNLSSPSPPPLSPPSSPPPYSPIFMKKLFINMGD